ncbi:transcriptional regulator, TetR family [Pseudodesulfovibrio mercurii]|uniref:Transcriptional regulator, TetR family n=1 Tax=Pseudodesulfovibrio mercurii TaxID=641491 RepID=F0JJG5_9BACT|nr:TetR/AcrR family transcriptional regulator [Pseudodesulfovibrio mercurii]EGB16064.1 transcriptional regulator, TetR family [Pseudodesulfovibrio mercurii]
MGTDVKARRGRPKTVPDAERRRQIVQAAEKLFVRKGFAGTCTREIAACCRISKQTLYRLFPGKLDLFAAVVESHRLKMIDFGDGYDDLPLDQALARMFMIDIDQQNYEIRAAFLRTANIESLQHPQIRDILRRHGGHRNRMELKEWLDRQCRKGRLAIQNTDNAAHMLLDVFTGAVIFDALGGFSWSDREERIAHFRQCIAIFLEGALPAGKRAADD